MTMDTTERLADHFVSYLFDEFSGSRHVRRVASWVGFALKAIESVAGGTARQNRKRQVVFDYAGRHFKARYDHKIGTRGGIEIVEIGEQRGSPDVGMVVQISSLSGAEEVYGSLQVLLDEYLDAESAAAPDGDRGRDPSLDRRREAQMSESLYDERLMCEVVSLSYDFQRRTGNLHLLDSNCCDMTGCVALFESIDPNVVAIDTQSGSRADTAYRKVGADWKAFGPRELRE